METVDVRNLPVNGSVQALGVGDVVLCDLTDPTDGSHVRAVVAGSSGRILAAGTWQPTLPEAGHDVGVSPPTTGVSDAADEAAALVTDPAAGFVTAREDHARLSSAVVTRAVHIRKNATVGQALSARRIDFFAVDWD